MVEYFNLDEELNWKLIATIKVEVELNEAQNKAIVDFLNKKYNISKEVSEMWMNCDDRTLVTDNYRFIWCPSSSRPWIDVYKKLTEYKVKPVE